MFYTHMAIQKQWNLWPSRIDHRFFQDTRVGHAGKCSHEIVMWWNQVGNINNTNTWKLPSTVNCQKRSSNLLGWPHYMTSKNLQTVTIWIDVIPWQTQNHVISDHYSGPFSIYVEFCFSFWFLWKVGKVLALSMLRSIQCWGLNCLDLSLYFSCPKTTHLGSPSDWHHAIQLDCLQRLRIEDFLEIGEPGQPKDLSTLSSHLGKRPFLPGGSWGMLPLLVHQLPNSRSVSNQHNSTLGCRFNQRTDLSIGIQIGTFPVLHWKFPATMYLRFECFPREALHGRAIPMLWAIDS